jgi:hypothetical protein
VPRRRGHRRRRQAAPGFPPGRPQFGSLAGQRYDVPITELFDLAASAPADTGHYRSRILSVQQTGDAAFVTVAEEGYWGTMSFVDYLSLARIDGQWTIVSKLFAHTHGEPPDLG